MRKEIKLYVTSVIKMTMAELRDYAERVASRAEDLEADEFIDKIKKGDRICMSYPDETFTSYEIIKEN